MSESPAGSILVVEDDATLRETLVELLQGAGFVAVGAPGGEEALTLFRAEPAGLILTDLMMPGMDGLAFVRRVREYDTDTPIVILTGYASLENAVEALRAGATDFATKPFRNEELLAVVRRTFAGHDPRVAALLRASLSQSWRFALAPSMTRDVPAEIVASGLASRFGAVAVAAGFARRLFALRRALEEALYLYFSTAAGPGSIEARFDDQLCCFALAGFAPDAVRLLTADHFGDAHAAGPAHHAFLVRSFADEVVAGPDPGAVEIRLFRPESGRLAADQD